MNERPLARCASCDIPVEERACDNERGKGPRGCPTLGRKDLIEKAREEYRREEVGGFARQAAVQEAEGYVNREPGSGVLQPVKGRLQETCEFAARMGYRRLGLVFCIGLRREARVVAEVLEVQGFEVVSALCKVGSVPKEEIGVRDEEKLSVGCFEAMCNPVMQAMVMNDAGTELNVVVGLCVGHDSLFIRYSEAPVTVLAAKDRVTGHNPLAAVYNADSYYAKLKHPGF